MLTEPTQNSPDTRHTNHTNQETTKNDPFDRFWEWSTHDAVAFFTFVLAIFTGALVVVSAVQIKFLIRADETARISADAAKIATDAAAAHSGVAEKQLAIQGLQTDIIEKQHAVGRMQFVATHRPILRVRYFRLINLSDEEALIRFTIANVGSSDAKMFSNLGKAAFFPFGNPPSPMYFGSKEMIAVPTYFGPGGMEDADIILNKQTPGIIAEQWSAGYGLYVFGYISYSDILENARTTAFCRTYIIGRERFEVVNDADYEYED